jgi:hypothetical protein
MFYKIIEKKRNQWLNSPDCVISDIIAYIERQHKMRDAQIEAIKTYLYLKIACQNRPLWQLFAEGTFNTTNVDDLEVKSNTRKVLENNPAALSLWEYATIEDENGNKNSPAIEKAIRTVPNDIDYAKVLKDLFFNVDYTDYLFSLPMGAGKTYLMAALIYLNLYFAQSEPDNKLFAHNFIIFVPSGLKTSIIPSLRDMQHFNPKWILPDPVATQLLNLVKYEWLQEASSASKSNLVKNPNARKISMHTANPNLMGLVAVTNAEKVILDRVDKATNIDETLLRSLSEKEQEEYKAAILANELRTQIGNIPNLCILIDEVHHASDDQKLRQVVNKWMTQQNLNSVLGFTGTPNMNPALKVDIYDDVKVKCTQYANVVTYYPLIKGIANFLKSPTVRHADLESESIIEQGLREFFDKYKDTVYGNGTTAKIAIYAPSIEILEEQVYPQACAVCSEYGLNPAESVLKFHNGNKKYKAPEDAKFDFDTLDSPLSTKRVILLVGIGREGWNCKSLTSVILSQRNSCPENMVLQISCRCLREVDDAGKESALIWLNKSNEEKLNKQLKEQQYTTIAELCSARAIPTHTIHRYSRMDKVNLPSIDFYQVKINYHTVEIGEKVDMASYLNSYQLPLLASAIVYTGDFSGNTVASDGLTTYGTYDYASFRDWIDLIVKESMGTLSLKDLLTYETQLRSLFTRLCDENGILKPDVNQLQVRSDIRKAFVPKRTFKVEEELIPEEASLLKVNALTSPIDVPTDALYIPTEERVNEIIHEDALSGKSIPEEVRRWYEENHWPIPGVDDGNINARTYHYLPYHMDSKLEESYMNSVINHIKNQPKVEIYFNGDDTLTDFRIRCYSNNGKAWKLLGYYYPDFIMLTRNEDKNINKIVIVETKGEGFAGKFVPRREFMEDTFIRLNNEKYGRERFQFLYVEDTMSEEQRLQLTNQTIETFLLK